MEATVYVGDEVVPFLDLPAMPGESAHIWYLCGAESEFMLMGHNAKYDNLGFLGGLREADERVVDAAVRECMEESGHVWALSHLQRLMTECLNAKRFFCRVSNTRRYHFILKDATAVAVDALNTALRATLAPLTEEEKKKRGHECDRLELVEMAALMRGGDAVPGLREPCKAPLAYYAANQSRFA